MIRFCAAAVTAALVMTACGGSQAPPAQRTRPAGAKDVDPATAGSLRGRVSYEGPAVNAKPIAVGSDAICMRENPNGIVDESLVVDNGGLNNVFVYVKDGLGNYWFDTPTTAVRLDQKGCRYLPHVLGIRTGQPLEIVNSDSTLHNVHASGNVNQGFNFGQQIQGVANTRTFTAPEVMVHFKCDVHGWMNAHVGVVDHPYFAVTAQGGTFEMTNLPAGTYTIEAWHEKLGTQTRQVTVSEKETKEITLTFKAAS
jgi:hypothetical protein